MSAPDQLTVGYFPKNERFSIQVSLVLWQEADCIDIREVYMDGDIQKMTKRGVRLPLMLLPRLVNLLAKCEQTEVIENWRDYKSS